ncbi:MAG: SdrD B-like domain-containing protein [Chloroflexota bacterium]
MYTLVQEILHNQCLWRYGRRVILSVLVLLCMLFGVEGLFIATGYLGNVALAQSQNEIQVELIYDGTEPFADPGGSATLSGSAPETHTPGQDGGLRNGVVRTFDTYSVRVDWNINEEAATDVTLTVVVPSHSEFRPDGTGMFAGCDPATSSFTNAQTLVCVLGDQREGSHGSIRPIIQLMSALDNETFNVTATLTTSSGSAPVSDDMPQDLTVSETAEVNWIKNEPSISAAIMSGGEEGYVLLYELSAVDIHQSIQKIGIGAVNDSQAIAFYDHLWDGVPSARLATNADMTAAGAGFTGRTVCGKYDGTGGLPATTGTWNCGTPTTGAGGYPVIPVTVSGMSTNPAPLTNVDTTTNTAKVILAGQIAFWFPKGEVDTAIADTNNANSPVIAEFHNSIAHQDATSTIITATDVIAIESHGTNLSTQTETTEDNTAIAYFGAALPTFSGSGGITRGAFHDIRFWKGTLSMLEYEWADPDGELVLHLVKDIQSRAMDAFPGASTYAHAHSGNIATGGYIAETPRGQKMTIVANFLASGTSDPLSGCMAFDTTHYNITDLPSAIDIKKLMDSPSNYAATDRVINVMSSRTVAPSDGPAVHVLTGHQIGGGPGSSIGVSGTALVGSAIYGDSLNYGIEITNAAIPTVGGSTGIDYDGLSCNDADAGSLGWVAASDLSNPATAALFDPDGDGLYQNITRARVRLTDSIIPYEHDFHQGIVAHFGAQVLTDIVAQRDEQELFAFASHAMGDWDPSVDANPPTTDCGAFDGNDWTAGTDPNDDTTTTGWCNGRYVDDGANSSTVGDDIRYSDTATVSTNGWDRGSASVDFLKIVEAQLSVAKSNVNGVIDIKDNDQLVQYAMTPSVVGASAEALTNVRLVDSLGAYYEFVRFVSTPTTPGATCSVAGQIITCQYSEPDPTVDTGALPEGLPGGWPTVADGSSTVVIEVRVTGAVANIDSLKRLDNYGYAFSSEVGPWDELLNGGAGGFSNTTSNSSKTVFAVASSYMPFAHADGEIVKHLLNTGNACDEYQGTPPADWATRCAKLDYDETIQYTLQISNTGSYVYTDVRVVDVFAFNGDNTEPASNTSTQSSSTPKTVGDGRTPASDFAGTIEYVSATVTGTTSMVMLFTADAPAGISRDPDRTWNDNTWCDAIGGSVQNGGGNPCPATAADVTAIYAILDGPINPNDSASITLELEPQNYECDDIWTNTFGMRAYQLLLPVRSNDVSMMPGCYLRVGGLLWEDVNNDEMADNGDNHTTFAGVEVHLYDAGGSLVVTTTTNINGEYVFEGLSEGNYQVRIPNTAGNQAILDGYASSTGADNIDGQVDPDNNTDNDDNGYNDPNAGFLFSALPISLTKESEITTAVDGIDGSDDESQANAMNGSTPAYPQESSNLTVDFGLWQSLNVGNQVWRDDGIGGDTADNGVIDGSEQGIDGVTVELYLDDDGTPGFSVGDTFVMSDTTQSGGYYTFTQLISETYVVHIPASNFGSNGALVGHMSSDDSTGGIGNDPDADADDDDDNGIDDSAPATNGISSAPIDLQFNTEPTNDGDGDNGNLTVDFGFVSVIPLVAVEKMLNTPDPVIPGASVTFTIRITNTGTTTITTLPLTDTYSTAYLTYVGIRTTPESDTTANNGQIVWNDLTQAAPNGFDMDFGPGDVWDVVVEFAARLDTTSLPNSWTVNTAQVFTHTVTDTVRIYAPTSVLLSSRDVAVEDEVVVLSWSTVDETDLIGFHILRMDEGEDGSMGEPVHLTDDEQMILAQDAANGTDYRYADVTGNADANHHYLLEMVMADGTRSLMDMGTIAQAPSAWTVYLPVLRR